MAYKNVTEQNDMWNNKPKNLKEGDVIEGRVISIREARDEKSSRTAILELTDGSSVGVWLSTVIDGAFRQSVQEGNMVRITYVGVGQSKAGREFNDYTVEVDTEA